MQKPSKNNYRDWLWINSFALMVLLGLTIFPGFHFPDQTIHAEIAREMSLRHDFITPYFNGLKYFDAAPLYYWFEIVSIKLLGFQAYGLHWVNLIFAIIILNVTYGFSLSLHDRAIALSSTLLQGCNLIFLILATAITPLVVGSLLINLTLLSFLKMTKDGFTKHFNYYFWLSLALLGLTLGPATIILILAILGFWLFCNNQFNILKKMFTPSALCLFLFATLPWYIFAQKYNPQFLYYFFIEDTIYNHFQIMQFIQSLILNTFGLLIGFLPWSLLCIIKTVQYSKSLKPISFFYLLWIVFDLIFISLFHNNDFYWLLTLITPASLLYSSHIAHIKLLTRSTIYLTAGTCVSLIAVTMTLFHFYSPSIIPLITQIKPLLNTNDVVVSYRHLYPELPALLEQFIVVVNWENKPGYSRYAQQSMAKEVSDLTFWPYWNAKDRRFFMFVPKKDYPLIVGKNKLDNPEQSIYYIGETIDTILITNKKDMNHG